MPIRPSLLAALLLTPALAQPADPALLQGLRWRCIGPFRGGRTVAAEGVPDRLGLFYMAPNNGGIWRSTDFGRTWTPIFDGQPTGSIGALAVAPSNPDVIYAGSGEGLQRPDLSVGNGIYKSTDAGRTWTHLGLRDAQQIPAILVDPKNPDRLFVAALGHPYGPNAERGVFRSLDGGRTFQKVLFKDADTGAVALAFDPSNPNTLYAALWAARQAPWEDGEFSGGGSGLYKSTDGGTTWRPLGKGLPGAAQGLGRIGFAVAPSRPSRLYAQVEAREGRGTYRSEDGGGTWTRVNAERRVSGRGDDFAEIRVDPRNPDLVYAANTSTYRSTDGGRTWTALKGAPGGDDYHSIWINPKDPQQILLGADQGATLTVNGGKTWSSWYNQPTAQFYHVATDRQFPYRVYGGQQESGSVGIRSRGDSGAITFRDWHPVGVEEYGYVAPDPLHPDLIYGGKATRFDRRTGQTVDVSPDPLRQGGWRFLRTMPLMFSPVDPHTLYLAGNVLFKTTDGGQTWDVLSPDLSRTDLPTPPCVGTYAGTPAAKIGRRGVIYALAPSPKDGNLIWAGTDDGLIHVTRDGGKSWRDVTPKGLPPWSKIAGLEASRFDPSTCYAAVNALRLDDLRPHLLRTRDGGATWQEVVAGLPADGPVNVVREDPVRPGLLYAGTEQSVYVSFDAGEHWQSLRRNLPATSIRDLVVHDDDLVVATHGRSFWILDDVAPLRELTPDLAAAPVHLFRPQAALRWRASLNTDTPLPPEEPAGENPPDGALLDFWLKAPAKEVRLEILDAQGEVLRTFDSQDRPKAVDPTTLNVPSFWIRPPQALPAAAGMHRFVWDLRLAAPPAFRHEPTMAAEPEDTPLEPQGVLVPPGDYRVRLTVDGKVSEQPLLVRMDPRVTTPAADLARQYDLGRTLAAAMALSHRAVAQGTAGRFIPVDKLKALNGQLGTLLVLTQQADVAPTPAQVRAAERLKAELQSLLAR
ncbi:hypothetical protein GETHPA_27640 [Geothrix rubra]|uniref:Sortilin N-terminal domain-containing protein n=1 Tax=Geothrix rubra TaxID=2927977 RepID=A0ABQ5QA53_9BACT|nr:hypothetical protein [Geothrix rubra]GLH71231.1 hypothetical protein GETHPA_27640 [Geothrix rubra]